jgi:hypothetical protein
MCYPPPDPVVSGLSLMSPIRVSRRGKCLRSHGSATKVGTTRVPAGHRPLFAGPAFCVAVTDVAESQERTTELAKSGYGARIGGLRLEGGEQLQKFGILDDHEKSLIEDYRYYLKTGTQQHP